MIASTGTDGSQQVFAGCYTLRLVQPAAQITPPFNPLGIVRGTLKKSPKSFDQAEGACSATP